MLCPAERRSCARAFKRLASSLDAGHLRLKGVPLRLEQFELGGTAGLVLHPRLLGSVDRRVLAGDLQVVLRRAHQGQVRQQLVVVRCRLALHAETGRLQPPGIALGAGPGRGDPLEARQVDQGNGQRRGAEPLVPGWTGISFPSSTICVWYWLR
jgi:hypothetical protein